MGEMESPIQLKEYIETRLNLLTECVSRMEARFNDRVKELDVRYQQRYESQQIAIAKSETAMEERLKGMNEFRDTLTDQAAMLMPRIETTQMIGSLAEKVNKLENRLDSNEGKLEGSRTHGQDNRANMGMWIAFASIVLGIVALMVKFIK